MSTLTPNYKLEKPESTDYYDVNVQNRNWEKIDSELKDIDDKKADLGEDGKILSEQLPPMKYDPAGSAAAVQKNLDAHTSNKKNPHGVTADQVGADPEGSANAVKQILEAHTGNKQNPHGVTAAQVGAYSKEQALSSATAALFGLGSDAVPDDALRLLGRLNSGLGNEYIWEKKKIVTTYPVTSTPTTVNFNTSYTAYYSDEIEYDPFYKNGAKLKNPIRYYYNRDTVESLIGKYYTTSNTSSEDMTLAKVTSVDTIYNSNASGSGEMVQITEQIDTTSFGFLNSPEADTYPPTDPDGYDYVSLGQLGEKARIVTGSYVGNGKSGESNPNTLNFAGKPCMVYILSNNYASDYCNGLAVYGGSYMQRGLAQYDYPNLVTWGETSMSWYNSNSADRQFNASGTTYFYAAVLQ